MKKPKPIKEVPRRGRRAPASRRGPAHHVARGGEPRFRQERSRRTFAALVDAAEVLFAERGYDGTGSPEIAEQAGASVGTFYRYFDDKKQAFLEVSRRHLDRMLHATLDGLSPEALVGVTRPRSETIGLAVDALFRSVAQHPQLYRSLDEMSLRDPEVAALRHGFEQASRQRLAEVVAAVTPRDRVPDPQAMAWVLNACAIECAAAAGGLRGTGAPAPARLRETLIALVERILFSSAAAAS